MKNNYKTFAEFDHNNINEEESLVLEYLLLNKYIMSIFDR